MFHLLRQVYALGNRGSRLGIYSGLRWVNEDVLDKMQAPLDRMRHAPWKATDHRASLPNLRQGGVADAELAAAESLVRGYGDSADRKAMLESLAALHRKR
jgi:hypothetical protein